MFDSSEFSKEAESKKVLKNRSSILLIILLLIGFISLSQIFKLTIFDQERYLTGSEENRITIIPINNSRGIIKLGTGELVAENVVFQNLILELGDEKELFIISSVKDLGKTLELDTEQIQNIIKKIDFNKRYRKVTLLENLSNKHIEKYLLDEKKWPFISLQAELRRFLIDGPLFSHLVGYLGYADSEDEEIKNIGFETNPWVGKTGLEKEYEEILRGSFGFKTVEVDVHGEVIREISRIKPSEANTIYLSLDRNLQMLAREELNGRRGAIVALDPNNGLIKAFVSSPDFDPNILNRTEKGRFEDIAKNDQGPFFNRVISGKYPPASTLKPFIGLLGLQEGIIEWPTTVEDPGFFQVNGEGRKYRGWKEDGHGTVNLKKAIVESSDVYFYELSTQISVDKISSFLESFGFASISGIDMFGEGFGVLPDRKWKLGNIGETWFVGDTVNLGIGQGYITTTPIQLAVAVSALANKGKVIRPRVVERINDVYTSPEVLEEVILSDKSNWIKMEKAMVDVIESWQGTAHNLFVEGDIRLAGKTGTAQIKSLFEDDLSVKEEYSDIRKDKEKRDHALFVGYGPVPDPQLTVVIVVENGESASTVAAPIAKKMINLYIKSRS